MDFNTAIGIIKKDLEDARSLLEQLSPDSGLPLAELEIARLRVKSALEMLSILPQLGEKPAVKEHQHEPRTVTKKETPTEPKVNKEPMPEKISEIKEEQKITVTKSEPVQPKVPEGAKTILADKFGDQNRLGEQITSAKQDEVIASVISLKPIEDIASAIRINDRFYFIRELFSGDSLAYQDTIKRLNSASSLGEAMKILDNSTVMGSDPAAQSAFVDIVRRKFNLNV